jgi:tellurite resistance protein TehA-like permease
MVDYMTTVYWLFIMASMGALILLRLRHPEAPRPVKTPLFPLFPAGFMALALYMFVSSLLELGVGALAGAGVMAVGVVIVLALEPPADLFKAETAKRSDALKSKLGR